ncbi:MAG: ABC transporter permease [Actinomycetales bacterium]
MTTVTKSAPVQAKPRSQALLQGYSKYGIVIAAVALFIILSLTTPGFFSLVNVRNVLDQQAPILIAAAPLTLVLIAGQFDVSLSAVYITAPLVGLQVEAATGSLILAVGAAVLAGAIAGVLNSALIVRVGINSFISTLATSYIITGFGYLISNQAILTPSSRDFRAFAVTHILGISSATWLALLVVAVCWILLSATRYGRYVFATGANSEAAIVSGVRTRLIVASTFVMTAAGAALAGMVNASQSMSAQATDDFSFVFTALAAVVVGGTSIAGGAGAVWRTMAGALFIAMMNNGFNLNQIDPIYQRIILGLVILLAVAIDAISRSRHAT